MCFGLGWVAKARAIYGTYCNTLDVKLMVGVGAAFDIHSGISKKLRNG